MTDRKKYIGFSICFFAIVFAFSSLASCGDAENETEKDSAKDSVPVVVDPSETREVQTDSGKLIITHVSGRDIDDAVLMDASGKLLARGYMRDNLLTGAWLRYDEKGNVIKALQYDAGAILHVLDPEDFKTKRIELSEMGVSIAVPSTWDTLHTGNPANIISLEPKEKDAGLAMSPNINITRGVLEAGQTLESLSNDAANILHQAFARVESVDTAYVMIDSIRSFRWYGKYYTEDNLIGFLDAIIIKNGYVYVVSCAAQNREQGEFLKYQSVFENLVMSIQIND